MRAALIVAGLMAAVPACAAGPSKAEIAAAQESLFPKFPFRSTPQQDAAIASETCSPAMLSDCLATLNVSRANLRREWSSGATDAAHRDVMTVIVKQYTSSSGIDWTSADHDYMARVVTEKVRGQAEARSGFRSKHSVSSECHTTSGEGWSKVECTTDSDW